MEKFTLQDFKSDTLAASITDSDSSATLSSGNFTDFATENWLVIDYNNITKREIVKCTVSGTTVTITARGEGDTSASAHDAGAPVMMDFVSPHYNYISGAMKDGWTEAGHTWTYASASTFTISGDHTDIYAVGDKLKMTNDGSTKYFYITAVTYGSPNTTVTVTGGTDYTIDNSAITSPYYSKMDSPVGFPAGFTIATRQTLFISGRNAKIIGWDWLQGDGSSDNKSETITYGSSFAFATRPNVGISGIGLLDGSDPSDIGDGNDTGGGNKIITEAREISTTTFKAAITLRDGGNTNATVRYMYDYTIDGTI